MGQYCVYGEDPMRPAQILCKYAGMLGRSFVIQVTEQMRQQRQLSVCQLLTLHMVSSSSVSQNAVSLLLPPGRVKCLGAVLRVVVYRFGSAANQSGHLSVFGNDFTITAGV